MGNPSIQIQTVQAKPRKLRCIWSLEATSDLRNLYYEALIKQISDPDYELTKEELEVLEELIEESFYGSEFDV